MSARAASRSRSSSAASSASGSRPSVPGPSGQSATPDGHVRQALQLHVEVAHGAEQPGQPTELLPERLGPDGQHAVEEREGGPQAAGGHPHVVQLLGVLARAGCRAPWRAARRAGAAGRRRRARPWWMSAEMSVGPRSGVPGISSPSASSPASNLESRGRLEPARRCAAAPRSARARRASRAGPRPRPGAAAWAAARCRPRSWCRRARPRPRRRRRRAGRRGAGGCGPGAPRAAGARRRWRAAGGRPGRRARARRGRTAAGPR